MLAARLPVVVALALLGPATTQPREVLVSAAVSLTEAMREAARLYEARSGERVVLNLAASNTLARQIRSGARVDVFVSADEAQMDAVAGEIVLGTRVDLLTNQLAIAVPADRPAGIASARDLTAASVRRVALGDPAAVPAGVYARRYLEGMGLWTRLEPKLVPSGSVRLALAAVEHGAADAAIVYRTDIAAAKGVRTAAVVPVGEGPRIVYPAAAMASGANPAGARRLLAFLRSAEGAAVFTRAGFTPLP